MALTTGHFLRVSSSWKWVTKRDGDHGGWRLWTAWPAATMRVTAPEALHHHLLPAWKRRRCTLACVPRTSTQAGETTWEAGEEEEAEEEEKEGSLCTAIKMAALWWCGTGAILNDSLFIRWSWSNVSSLRYPAIVGHLNFRHGRPGKPQPLKSFLIQFYRTILENQRLLLKCGNRPEVTPLENVNRQL